MNDTRNGKKPPRRKQGSENIAHQPLQAIGYLIRVPVGSAPLTSDISDTYNEINPVHGRALGEVAVEKEGHQTFMHIGEVTGIDIVEMVVAARIGIVEGPRSTDENLPEQTLLRK